jgi:hypothetical protein
MAEWRLLERFRKFFGFSSGDSIPIGDTFLPALVESERTSRYITDTDQFRGHRPPAEQLHFRAFLPPRKHPTELSMFLTTGLPEREVWGCGDRHVAPAAGKPVIGRGDLFVADVRSTGDARWGTLDVLLDNEPARHCNVVGWPPLAETEARKLMAIALRNLARPVQHS